MRELKQKRSVRDYNLTPDKFVEAWLDADSLQDAADLLEMDKKKASQIATNLRKVGVNLPRFSSGWAGRESFYPRKGSEVIADLNALIAKRLKS
jgi:hypothetical protein